MDKKLRAALDEVPPVPVAERNRFYKGFLYGEFGVGKTVCASKCAKTKGLIIATDTGTDSILNHSDLLDKIDIVPYSGLSQLTAIGQAVTDGEEDYSQYDLIIVDTISQVQEEYLDWLLDNFKFSGNYREKAIPKPGKHGLSEQEITGLPDYHLARNNMRLPIKTLIKAPIDVLFLAHLREPSMMEQQKGKLVRRPTVTETVYKLIAREASFLGLMEREAKKRTIQFATDRKTSAKSRLSELDDKTIDADNLPEILQKWKVK